MTRNTFILGSVALLSAAVLVQACAGEDVPGKTGNAAKPPANKTQKTEEPSKVNKTPPVDRNSNVNDEAARTTDNSEAELSAADRESLFSTAESFVSYYNKRDAKAIANLFSPNAEYIDEKGYLFRGRDAIEQAMVACFAALEDAQMELTIRSIRHVAPSVAIEDGSTTVTLDRLSVGPITTDYTAMHVKSNGKWQTVSVRESAPKNRRQHRLQLEQLSWLLGDWVDEGEDTLVVSSCRAVQGGNFLLREFRLHVGGEEVVSGEQRIGWDPPSGKLKSWVFDSDGGYSEGFWQRDDNRWILKSVGVSTEGLPATCTTIYTLIDENTMTWQIVNHEVAGAIVPDSDVFTVVRRAPLPEVEVDSLVPESR